ncbi:hypothetical protein AARAC_011068, partial [Aspergillus arachidicola]
MYSPCTLQERGDDVKVWFNYRGVSRVSPSCIYKPAGLGLRFPATAVMRGGWNEGLTLNLTTENTDQPHCHRIEPQAFGVMQPSHEPHSPRQAEERLSIPVGGHRTAAENLSTFQVLTGSSLTELSSAEIQYYS